MLVREYTHTHTHLHIVCLYTLAGAGERVHLLRAFAALPADQHLIPALVKVSTVVRKHFILGEEKAHFSLHLGVHDPGK